jgi:hypothetical protein
LKFLDPNLGSTPHDGVAASAVLEFVVNAGQRDLLSLLASPTYVGTKISAPPRTHSSGNTATDIFSSITAVTYRTLA